MNKVTEIFETLRAQGGRRLIDNVCQQLEDEVEAPTVWVFTPDYGIVLKHGANTGRVVPLGDARAPSITIPTSHSLPMFLLSLSGTKRLSVLMNIGDYMNEQWLIPLERCLPNPVQPRIESGVTEDIEGNAFTGAMVASIPDEGMEIYDPYVSSCSRFPAHPNQYGMSVSQGDLMVKHNAMLGMKLPSIANKTEV